MAKTPKPIRKAQKKVAVRIKKDYGHFMEKKEVKKAAKLMHPRKHKMHDSGMSFMERHSAMRAKKVK